MPTEISDWNDLDAVRNDLSGDYILVNDLNSGTAGYAGIGDDWDPIQDFDGEFDGDGYAIADLQIFGDGNNIALFGTVDSSGSVKNLAVIDAFVENVNDFGSTTAIMIGDLDGELNNCFVTGEVDSVEDRVGGMVGSIGDGVAEFCFSDVNVKAEGEDTGGFVGILNGDVFNCACTGTVEGTVQVGGFVGEHSGDLERCYSFASVSGDEDVGGLVGWSSSSRIFDCYTAADGVIGNTNVGGFTGRGDLRDVLRCFWDTESTNQSDASGSDTIDNDEITGLTTDQMTGSEVLENMTDKYDFDNEWSAVINGENADGDGYPIRRAMDIDRQGDIQNINITEFYDAPPFRIWRDVETGDVIKDLSVS